jgi:Zn-dependent protease with chaperone function
MPRTFPAARTAAALLLVLALPATAVLAGPQDTKVGETRYTYAKAGTVVRAEGAPTGKPAGTLPAGTAVRVLEVKLPWVRVSATAGGQPVEGWLRAFEAIEPEALQKPAEPPVIADTAATNVSGRDVSAAGRQFDADTEKSYRVERADLQRAYAQVDEMERATAQMDPYEAVEFLMAGDIGRRGNDLALPPRLPAEPVPQDGGGGGKRGPSLPGGLPGGLGGKLPGPLGKHAREVDTALKLIKGAGAARQLMDALGPSRPFATQHEYYLGRAVAANAIAKYGVDKDARRRAYVRRVGDAVVRVADPQRVRANYGGYHFEVLDSDEVNGVSGPGGFVLVTRGAVDACQTEDELAGILAHELVHVANRHAEQVIKKSDEIARQRKGVLDFLGAAGEIAGAPPLATQILGLFRTAVDAAIGVSVTHAWDRGFENEADEHGAYLLYDDFYDWNALTSFLSRRAAAGHAHGSASHASPAERAAALQAILARYGPFNGRPGTLEARRTRFLTSLGRAK